jgi:hypothetical protein
MNLVENFNYAVESPWIKGILACCSAACVVASTVDILSDGEFDSVLPPLAALTVAPPTTGLYLAKHL